MSPNREKQEMDAFNNNNAHSFEGDPELTTEEPSQWPSPKKRTKCSMCGFGDHAATTCPSSCCLKCGKKTASFQHECAECVEWASAVCKICGEQGHSKNDCPDHWRCYHSTIDDAAGSAAIEYSMEENPPRKRFKNDGLK